MAGATISDDWRLNNPSHDLLEIAKDHVLKGRPEMKKKHGFKYNRLVVVALVLLCVPMPAKAVSPPPVIFNIEFGTKGFTGNTGVVTGDTQATEYWNPAAGKPTNNLQLKDSHGNYASSPGVGVSYTLSGISNINPVDNSFSGGSDATLMSSYIYSVLPNKTLTFSGLVAGHTYGLYVFSQAASKSSGQQLTINTNFGVTATTDKSIGSTSSFSEGLNYLAVNVIADNQGKIGITYAPFIISGTTNQGDINGIVLSSTAHAPEPATLVLLSIGGMLVAFKLKGKVFKEFVAS